MKKRNAIFVLLVGLSFLSLLGCARNSYVLTDRSGFLSPQPPPILSTPAVFLLTNNTGFIANVRMEEQHGLSTGRLYARGEKLFYAPDEKKRPDRYGPSGGFSFVWDAAQGNGFALSEALQGYAPISHSASGAATNLVMETTATSRSQNAVVITAQMINGSQAKFESGSNSGQGGPPERIAGGPPPFNATLEKIRSEPPPEEVFKVPEGFTAYPSAEAMVDELSVRYRNLKRKDY